MQNTCFLIMRLNIWCKNKFYLVKVLKGFNCVWWFIRVVLHVGSVCQSDIRLSDCLDLFMRPAPAITRVEILYEVDLFNKLTSRFVSLKNDLGSYNQSRTNGPINAHLTIAQV